MRSPIAFLVGIGTGAFLVQDYRRRRAAVRFAAAALESLLAAIDANDAQTGAHVRRVAAYALVLADAVGLDEHQRRNVERVALFHDIGKIHEALFDITHDGTELSPEDRREIATHPRRGAEVLAPLSPFYPELAAGVLSHHERWDGTGYPRGLRGTEIPLAARIVTLADTFDAITHSRRYRDGRHARDAARIIAAGRGTQFDPALVDRMLEPRAFRRIVREKPARSALSGKGATERRAGKGDRPVPDVTFRWREKPDRSGARAHASPQPPAPG
ncbi:MAG TPA: HD domain-containing phosphohydrolase [Gemmatimonadaceae bacterium]|nr:HD domain-containing phosphohydrolase [Gemmatimonadaceae bacterium]